MEKLNTEKAKTLKKRINLIVGVTGTVSLIVNLIFLMLPAIMLVAPNCGIADIYTASSIESFVRFIYVGMAATTLSLFTIPNMLNEVK